MESYEEVTGNMVKNAREIFIHLEKWKSFAGDDMEVSELCAAVKTILAVSRERGTNQEYQKISAAKVAVSLLEYLDKEAPTINIAVREILWETLAEGIYFSKRTGEPMLAKALFTAYIPPRDENARKVMGDVVQKALLSKWGPQCTEIATLLRRHSKNCDSPAFRKMAHYVVSKGDPDDIRLLLGG